VALFGGPALVDDGVGPVLVVSAGTADSPVVEEAVFTCRAFGVPVAELRDVGVAGLHRLVSERAAFEEASVVIVVAGMEGALPSVVGGLVAAPVIGVPTSVGYGSALGGFTALFAMLTSCAAGITVANIDNGFGAAAAASRIRRAILAHETAGSSATRPRSRDSAPGPPPADSVSGPAPADSASGPAPADAVSPALATDAS
jgi:NCAIR mutase (PurE)-related protein